MSRKPRIEYEGAIYHIIQRGNNKEHIFKSDMDKQFIIDSIDKAKEMMNYKLYGYVIMDNHLHMVLQTLEKPLNKIMHQINNKFSKYYNRKYGRTGHVFEGRYKALNVQDERYLLALLHYIHMNPVKAGVCGNPVEYAWSSDNDYRNNKTIMVDIDTVMDILSDDRVCAVKKYKEYMETAEDEYDTEFEDAEVIGDENYVLKVRPKKEVTQRKSLEEILLEVTDNMTAFESIKNGSRQRSLTACKVEYVRKALDIGYTYKEIAQSISVSEVAIFRLLSKHSQ